MSATTKREHTKGCPGVSAWDIPEACRCRRPLVTRCNQCGQRLRLHAIGGCWRCHRNTFLHPKERR